METVKHTWLVRPMTKKDVPRIAELEKLCFRTPWSARSLAGELKNRVAHYLVIETDGVVVAYAGMWILFDEAHVTNVAVAPDFRRLGLGMRIMREMMALAVSLGAERMTLEVRESNLAAQSLYQKCGFLKAGVRRGYYSDTGEAAYILWNDNLPASLEKMPQGAV